MPPKFLSYVFLTQESKTAIPAFIAKSKGGEKLTEVRITEWLRLEGTSQDDLVHPLQGIKQGQLEEVTQDRVPSGLDISTDETSQPLWETGSTFQLPSQ